MDEIRNTGAANGSDSGIDGCASSSYAGSSQSHPWQNTNHSHSEATSAALQDDIALNLCSDDASLTEDEALSDDNDCEVVANVLEAIERNSTENNRNFQQTATGVASTSGRLPSKEEKQRQNEEIVIMESSSVSSETGSWESVFPQKTPDLGAEIETLDVVVPKLPTALREKENLRVLPDFSFSSKPICSAAAACFIDASSLMDDTEVYGSLTAPQLPEVGCCGPKPSGDLAAEIAGEPTLRESDLHSPNLSDEQKLLHRTIPEAYDIKDQFSLDTHQSCTDSPPEATIRSTPDEGIKIDTESRHRQDLERKQGYFIFRNSIQHFSGQVLSSSYPSAENPSPNFFSLPSVGSVDSNNFHHNPYLSEVSDSDAEFGFMPDTPHNSIVIHTEEPMKSTIKPVVAEQVCHGVVESPAQILRPFDSPSVRRKTETCPIMSGGLLPEDTTACHKKKVPVRDTSLSTSLKSWVVDMSDCQQSPKSNRLEKTAQSLDLKRIGTGFFVDMSDSDCHLEQSSSNGSVPTEDKKNLFSMFIDIGEKKIVTRKDPSSFTSRLSSSFQKQTPLEIPTDTEIFREQSSGIFRRTPIRKPLTDSKKRHSWNDPPSQSSVILTTRDNPRMFTSSLSIPDGDKPSPPSDKIPVMVRLSPTNKTISNASINSPLSPFDDVTSCKSMSAYSSYSNKSIPSGSVHSSAHEDAGQAVENGVPRRRRQDVDINETFDKSSSSLPDELLSTDATSPITDTDDITYQNELELDPSAHEQTAAEPQKTAAQPFESAQQAQTEHTMESLQAAIERQQKLLLETVTEESTPAAADSFVKLSDMDKPKFKLHAESNKICTVETDDSLSRSIGTVPTTTNRIERLFADSANKKLTGGRNGGQSMSRSTGNNNLTHLASSSDNLKSLSRLFPHLSNELSSSLPAEMQRITEQELMHSPSGAANAQVQNQCGGLDSSVFQVDSQDLSTASSANSSFSRSAIDSADESSISYRQPRRLGEDLLKMFLQEIATDVTLEVGGRRMRAHKCILRSRCQYFAAILAGNWVQSSGNVFALSGYSYDSVHFALCHIYSGAAHPPEGISLIELAALADLLGLEGLKEVTAYALRMQYCHNFHKPCSGCLDGILRVFPVTLSYGLDELYRKCLRWTCKHYVSVWPTRFFAELPADLLGRCSQHLVAHMNSESVLDTIIDSELILSLIAANRWAQPVENIVREIIEVSHVYISNHFASLVASDGFLLLGQDKSCDISRLENMILCIACTLSPEQSCRSYQRICRLHAVLVKSRDSSAPQPKETMLVEHRTKLDGDIQWDQGFLRLVADVLNAVENCLVGQCSRAMRTHQWQRMDLELRKKVKHMAGITEPSEGSSRRNGPHNTKSLMYEPTLVSRSGNNSTSTGCTSSSSAPSTSNAVRRSKDLYAVKMAIQQQSKREQEANRMQAAAQRTHQPLLAAERPTTLYLRPVRTAAERQANKSLEVNRATIQAIADNTNNRSSLGDHPPSTDRRTMVDIRSHINEPKKLSKSLESHLLKSAVNASAVFEHSRNLKTANSDAPKSGRDSSASGSKGSVTKLPQCKVDNASEVDISIDSLGGSMHSSIKSSRSNKSASQESLALFNATVRSKNLIANRLRQSPGSTTNTNTTTGSKSSRLSSLNSATSSPRDVAIRKNNLQVTAPARRSFVSAKSREILAAKQSASNNGESITHKVIGNGHKSSGSATNIKRPVVYPTTLHLRRTAKLKTTNGEGTTASSTVVLNKLSAKHIESTDQQPKIKTKNPVSRQNARRLDGITSQSNANVIVAPSKIRINTTCKTNSVLSKKPTLTMEVRVSEELGHARASSRPADKVDKLERSSTFCKESSGFMSLTVPSDVGLFD